MTLTHCTGEDCPLSNSCLRHTQQILGKQNFFARVPYDEKLAHCEYYYNESPSEQIIQQLAYRLWQQDGCPKDRALSYWLRAKQQLINQRRHATD